MLDKAPVELVALGEALIDFTQVGRSPAGQALFERNPGGAPANVAVQAARLGMSVQFVGKVGADIHGDFLRTTLASCGVDVSALACDEGAFTTLAFVEVDKASGERTFSFARKPGADTRLMPSELPEEALRSCRVLHVGSLSLTDEPARSATLRAVALAKQAGALVSCDPNYRASLWPSEGQALAQMRPLLGEADLVKLNEEEARLLCGTDDAECAAARVLSQGASLVVVTLGGQGAVLATRKACVRVASPRCAARDTTGAGDSFWGALLCELVHERGIVSHDAIAALDAQTLEGLGRFACAAASCCVERAGGIPAMPSRKDVLARLEGR